MNTRKIVRFHGTSPPEARDNMVYYQQIKQVQEQLLELFPASDEDESWGGCPSAWRDALHHLTTTEWPQPIWYRHDISYISERGRIVLLPKYSW